MDDIDFDDLDMVASDEAPRKRKRGKRGRSLALLVSFGLGAAAAWAASRYLPAYLPAGFGGGAQDIEGAVVAKRAEGDRLLLTVESPDGAVLVTFTERVSELELLVSEGDSVTLAAGEYAPFIENPTVRSVRKPRRAAGTQAMPAVQPDSMARPEAATVDSSGGAPADSSAAPAAGGDSSSTAGEVADGT